MVPEPEHGAVLTSKSTTGVVLHVRQYFLYVLNGHCELCNDPMQGFVDHREASLFAHPVGRLVALSEALKVALVGQDEDLSCGHRASDREDLEWSVCTR